LIFREWGVKDFSQVRPSLEFEMQQLWAFIAGMWAIIVIDWARAKYLRKYHIQRIAYELTKDTMWCSLSPEVKKLYLAWAEAIYKVNR
jgi:hypothetical protein